MGCHPCPRVDPGVTREGQPELYGSRPVHRDVPPALPRHTVQRLGPELADPAAQAPWQPGLLSCVRPPSPMSAVAAKVLLAHWPLVPVNIHLCCGCCSLRFCLKSRASVIREPGWAPGWAGAMLLGCHLHDQSRDETEVVLGFP